MVARHSGRARCCSFFRTSHIVQKPIVVENDLCGWLVMQNLLRDWFMRFWWPATSIPQRCQCGLVSTGDGFAFQCETGPSRVPLRPPFQRIWASTGASCLRIARGNCGLPAGHDQTHPPAIWKLRKPFSKFRLGDQTTLPWLLQQHAGQLQEELPPTNPSLNSLFSVRPTRISCMVTLIAERYAPERNFGGHRITVALW